MKPVTGTEIALCYCAMRSLSFYCEGNCSKLFVNPIWTGIAVSCLVLWLITNRFKKQYRSKLLFGRYLLRNYKCVKEYPAYVSSIFSVFLCEYKLCILLNYRHTKQQFNIIVSITAYYANTVSNTFPVGV